jgi:hypothetical protein
MLETRTVLADAFNLTTFSSETAEGEGGLPNVILTRDGEIRL